MSFYPALLYLRSIKCGFGISVAISYAITKLFFESYELSVWCFFAAVISIAVFTFIP